MATNQTAVVIGATGLIGSLLTKELLLDDSFSHVKVLVRNSFAISHPKLDVQRVDFSNLTDVKEKLGTGDVIFSCIGTTQKSVKGDKNQYWKIDHDIPITVARLGAEAGFRSFYMVSSVGAKAGSKQFYLQLKGKTEDDIKAVSFQSTGIFRPSMLLGKRSENRVLERILQPISKVFSLFLRGRWSKFKAIEAGTVAKAMREAARRQTPGVHTYEYHEMVKLAQP